MKSLGSNIPEGKRLIDKILLGDADEMDLKRLDQIKQSDTDISSDVDDLNFMLDNIPGKTYYDEFDNSVYYGLRQMEYTYAKMQQKRKQINSIRNAAMTMLSISTVIFCSIFYLTTPYVASSNRKSGLFSVSRELLPDNSEVVLASKASYSFFHYPTGRRLKLTGNAHIRISTDSLRPFYISCDISTIKSSGGDFFAKVVQGQYTKVYVLNGLLEILNGHDVVRVLPGENMTISSMGTIVAPTREDDGYDFWYSGTLHFKSKPLGEVIGSIEMQYNVIIKVDPMIMGGRKFTGTLHRIESIDEILKTLCKSFDLEYYVESRSTYILTENMPQG